MQKGRQVLEDAENDSEGVLWQEYGQTRQPELRTRLIGRHLEMAHRIAVAIYRRRVTNTVPFEDFLQLGRVGLLEAIDRYDPAREASFATFATYRIRGAILNGLEKATEAAAQAADRRRARIRDRTQSFDRDEETREGATRDLFAGMVDMTILLAMGYVLEDDGHWNPAGAESAPDPYRSLHLEHVRARLHMLVDALPERERLIVRCHYFEQMEFQTIAELLEVTKGRVSQLHARALRLVKEAYEGLDAFDLSL